MFAHFTAEWWAIHGLAHLLGGVVWLVLFSIAPPFRGLPAPWRLYWVGALQALWERYQREYDPTYPVWSMAGDALLALAGAALALLLWALLQRWRTRRR